MIQENLILSPKKCKHINNGITFTLERRIGYIDIFNRITDIENMEMAYNKSQKGKSKYKREALIFAQNPTYNLYKLKEELDKGVYEFSGYFEFKVYEPKERVIHAPYYRDKIVQLAVVNILKEIYYPSFIYDSYACIDNKGTHKCVERISYFMRKAKWEYGDNAYILKVDMRKFFYSIDRQVLKRLLRKKIKCNKTLDLLFKIIDSADAIDEKGLPLGNTISQLCANITMNELDQYCKRNLRIKYYVRYADDVVIIAEDKEKAVFIKEKVIEYVGNKLNLRVNKNKTKIFPIAQGVNTVGFKIYPTHKLMRDDSKRRIKQKLRKMKRLIQEGRLSIEKAEQIINSWYGHAKQGDSYNFTSKIIAKYDYIYLNKNDVLKVDEDKLKEVKK